MARIAEQARLFGNIASAACTIDLTDGNRTTFASAATIQLRPSSNAPELGCYTEAASEELAMTISRDSIAILPPLPETRDKGPAMD